MNKKNINIKSIITYNADLDKLKILKENKGKSGVYRLVNIENGKSYVGSSTDLGKRFQGYFDINYLAREIKKNKSRIYRSLLKYGYSNFILEILEYCAVEKTIEREQYYLDLFKPDYNILTKAGSSLGFKHSPEAIAKIKNRLWTEEKKAKHLEHLNRIHANPEFQANQLDRWKRLNADSEFQAKRLERIHSVQSHQVSVFDTLTNKTSVYSSIREAAKAIRMSPSGIVKAFKRKGEETSGISIKNKRYEITKLP